jgi:anthranilate phosphoribosyltransferase
LVGELKDGVVREYEIAPQDFGLNTAPTNSFKVANAEESKKIVLDVLDGKPGPACDIVCLNAGATLYVAGIAKDIAGGIALAQAAVTSGSARHKLDAFVAATQFK